MKRNRRLILLPLLALGLIGCSDNKTNSNKPSLSEAPISNRVSNKSDKKDSSSTKKSETSKDSKKTDSKSSASKSDKPSSSAVSPSTSSPSKSSEEEESKWPDKIKDDMRKYLGGNVLPYVDLGANLKTIYESSTKTLSIIGDNIYGMTSTRLNKAKASYEAGGYTVTLSDDSMTAIAEEKGLSVTFHDTGILQLDAVYTESFDPSKASQWPQEIIDDLNNNINNHAADIPFVYLGSTNPTGEIDRDNNMYTITGGVWNDQITALAKSAFEQANLSIAKEENKWSVEVSNTTYGTMLTAKATLEDKTELEIHVRKEYFSKNYNAKMTIQYTEPFIEPVNGSWTNEINDFFKMDCDKHTVPYVYLGTMSPTFTIDGTKGTITGGAYNEEVLNILEKALNKENTSLVDDEKWTIKRSNDMITAIRIFKDKCSFRLRLSEGDLNEKAELEITYIPKYTVNESADWKAETKAAFASDLNGNEIPYVYLGNTDETVVFDEDSSIMTITGGTYYEGLLTEGYLNFKKAGWNYSISTEFVMNSYYDYYEYDTLRADKVINASTGEKLSIVLTGTDISESGVSGNCVMKITYDKPYTPPTGDAAKWDASTLDSMKEHLAGHTVPYVYLNSKNIQVDYVKKTYPADQYLSLTGGKFDAAMLNYAETQFAGWTNVKKTMSSFKAENVEEDGCKLSVELSNDYSTSKAVMKIRISEAFNPNVQADWSQEIKDAMKDVFNGHTLPYIPMGCYAPSFTKYPTMHNLTIRNLVWDDSILSLAKTALENAGWTVIENDYSSTPSLNAFSKNTDGSLLYLKLYKTGPSDSPYASIDAYYKESEGLPETPAKASWSDTEKAKLDALTENKSSLIPFLYMGDGEYTITDTSSSTTLKGSELYYTEILEFAASLKSLGYQKIGFDSLSSNLIKLNARYEDSEGNQISLTVTNTYSSGKKVASLSVSYKASVKEPTGEDAKWDDKTKAKIQAFVGEDVEIPYVFLGTLSVKSENVSTKELDLIGDEWKDSYLDKAYQAFNTAGWNTTKDTFDNTVSAVLTTPSNKQIKVVVLEVDGIARLQIFVK